MLLILADACDAFATRWRPRLLQADGDRPSARQGGRCDDKVGVYDTTKPLLLNLVVQEQARLIEDRECWNEGTEGDDAMDRRNWPPSLSSPVPVWRDAG